MEYSSFLNTTKFVKFAHESSLYRAGLIDLQMIHLIEITKHYFAALLDSTYQSVFNIVFGTLGIYITVILYTRLFGKRSFSKMSSFDFAMTVAVGSIIATTIMSESVSLLEGALGLLMVFALQLLAAYFRRYKFFRKIIDNKPTLLMDGETILYENMKSVRVTIGDLRSKLRESNVTQLSQVKAVIFETTGDMIVLHKDTDAPIDDWLLEDVKRKLN